MAMLGLARHSKDEDQRSALVKRAAKEKDRLTERERLHVEHGPRVRTRSATTKPSRSPPRSTRSSRRTRARPRCSRYQEISKGNTDHAIKIFEELLTIDPNNAEAYNQIGYFYGYRGDYDKAVEAFKRYQFIAADTANPFDSLGEVQAYSGRYNEALENLNRALAIKPDFVDSVKNIAVVHEGRGEYRKAIEQYERAAEIDGRSEEAARLLRRARRGPPTTSTTGTRCGASSPGAGRSSWKDKHAEIDDAFLDAALVLVDGRAAEAEKMVRAVKPKLDALLAEENLPKDWKPHFPQVNFMLALTLEEQGKADEALEYWKKNANPPRPFDNFEERRMIYEARAKVAVALAKKGDLDGAEKLIAENRKWNPSWAPTRPEETTVAELRREKVLAASK